MSRLRSLLLILTLFVCVVTFPFYRSHIFAIHFVDEDDNIVIGNYVSEGKKLYSDIFSQHQPSMFVLSSAIQRTLPVDNVLMVIKRHREFMIAWSILWFLILTARFGWPLFLTAAVIELVKISLLGNLFLAESLVIYPLLYVVAHVFTARKSTWYLEKVLLSVIFWLLWFSLTPLWPMLILLALLMARKHWGDRRFALIFLAVGALALVGLLQITSLPDYLYNALYINYKYYIPLTTPVGFFESIVKAFFAPLLAIFSEKSGELLTLIKVLSVGVVINLISLVTHKQFSKALALFTMLGLTSLRYIDPAGSLYGVFHMLPWFVLLILFNFLTFSKVRLHHSVIGIVIILASLTVSRVNLFDHRDPATDYYVHFSPGSDIREAVKILSRSTPQTIWVEPVLYWPHWRTDAIPYTAMINYYGWMDQTAPLKNALVTRLASELPTIVWAETSKGIGEYLGEYAPVMRDGKPSGLYLRQDQAQHLTSSVRTDLTYYRFEIN